MDHGDLETQSKQLDLVTSPTVDTVTPAVPTASSSRAIGPDLISRQSLWRKLRQQPRESAAIVVLIVTAIIWLDSGSSSKKTGSATTLDPLNSFDSYLSDFESMETGEPDRESADPVDHQSPRSFGGDLIIPQTQQSEFANTVNANYGSADAEPANSSTKYRDTSTTTARYPNDVDAYNSQTFTAAPQGAVNPGNSGTQQNRKVRFAGRIKPAN